MLHSPIFTSRLCTPFIAFLITSIVACNKGIPNDPTCGCEPEQQTIKKGGASLSKVLYPCGVLSLPIDSSFGPGTLVAAYLGFRALGLYNLLELSGYSRIAFFVDSNVQIYSVHYNYFISTNIRDLKGNLLVQINDNKWFIYTKAVGKYNYDAKGLEVFDKEGHIALSIDSKPYTSTGSYPTTLNVQGVIARTNNTVTLYELDRYLPVDYPYGTSALNKAFNHVYDSIPITPLFRYSGANWQHARVAN
jgi:hypothetical protein